MECTKPLVTVCTLTFNQQKYISHCLDSIVNQICNFRFELIVHDDASTDGTLSIINEYAARYPQIIRVIAQSENQYSKGLLYIYNEVISQAQGKYIAICEGDDYWTDQYKLQKQVDFLQKNPQYEMVHTNCLLEYDNGKVILAHKRRRSYDGWLFKQLTINNFILSPTTLFNKEMAISALALSLQQSIDKKWKTADLPIWLYIATRAKIGYIKDVCAVYRVISSSLSNNKDFLTNQLFCQSMLDIRQFMMAKAGVSEWFQSRIEAKFFSRLYTTAHQNKDKMWEEHYRKKLLEVKYIYCYRPLTSLFARLNEI